MCQELKDELDRGDELMRQVVEHFVSMGGASKVTGFVEFDGRGYEVTLEVTAGRYPSHYFKREEEK